MTYTPPEGVTIGSFAADTLPASFSAPAGAGISYKIYGTEAGAGTATSESEPEGYKITLSVDDAHVPIYIGDSKLTADEYVDSESGKVYKRTVNLFDKDSPDIQMGKEITQLYIVDNDLYFVTEFIPVEPNQVYIANGDSTATSIGFGVAVLEYDQTYSLIRRNADAAYNSFVTSATTAFIKLNAVKQNLGTAMIVKGSTVPETYIPYLQPTDPPAPLPAITASGETTITSTETLGDVELTGDWLAIMGSTEDESIDIGFTVDAEEYIAFVTVDDDPSIQVFDTITMPASADSFTLEVVSWGRERYTETVYNALS